MELSSRQLKIIEIVKQHAPITGEQIADRLAISRHTIRSDLSLLVMINCLQAKPKLGYFLGNTFAEERPLRNELMHIKVKDVQSMPIIVHESTSVNDAVVTLFLEDVGSLIVTDTEGILLGVVSRKDLLKVTLGNPNASSLPISLAMTRKSNVITVSPDEPILEAGKKMLHYQVYSLPVVVPVQGDPSQEKLEVVGRITKTTMTEVLMDIVLGKGRSEEQE